MGAQGKEYTPRLNENGGRAGRHKNAFPINKRGRLSAKRSEIDGGFHKVGRIG